MQHQAIMNQWINADWLSTGTYYSELVIEIQMFLFMKTEMKMLVILSDWASLL